jgi:hypothetical protein
MKACARLSKFLLAGSLFVSLASAQTIVEPTDRPVSLTGILRIAHGFGPPGYGAYKKTDVRIRYWVLDLPFQATVACSPSRALVAEIQCGATNRIRLSIPIVPPDNDLDSRARRLVGRKTTVTGVLVRRTTMSQITPIYMDVADVVPATATR